MKKIALFPGSFDPFTIGHKAVVERGLTFFDHIVIGVGINPEKESTYLLDPRQRVNFAKEVFKEESRVSVELYTVLTGDFCRAQGIRHILRGVRNASDFESEQLLDIANSRLYPEITTTLVCTPAEYMAVSSRLVREVISFGADPSLFLPPNIDINNYI
jgi:pantetheine-phosphate adenylyltransferase